MLFGFDRFDCPHIYHSSLLILYIKNTRKHINCCQTKIFAFEMVCFPRTFRQGIPFSLSMCTSTCIQIIEYYCIASSNARERETKRDSTNCPWLVYRKENQQPLLRRSSPSPPTPTKNILKALQLF